LSGSFSLSDQFFFFFAFLISLHHLILYDLITLTIFGEFYL
jgi:hypothetical protein